MEFLEFLAMQRAQYRSGLGEKFSRISALWNLVTGSDHDLEAIGELERHAHNLAGSGATFGFSELGLSAKALELAVHQLHDCHAAPSAAQRTEIEAAMRATHQRILWIQEERPAAGAFRG